MKRKRGGFGRRGQLVLDELAEAQGLRGSSPPRRLYIHL